MALGFSQVNGLSESDTSGKDRAIFDNLGGPGITDDILLFDGNSSAQSILSEDSYQIIGVDQDTFSVIGEGRVAFSVGTEVTFNNVNYIVQDSDGVSQFKLFTADGNVALTNITEKYPVIRSDSISQDELFNLNTDRGLDSSGSQEGISGEDSNDVGGTGSVFASQDLSAQIAFINEQLSLLSFKKSRIPITTVDSTLDGSVTFKGPISIINSANTPPLSNGDPNLEAPGIYIVSGSNAKRAFGDKTNPWIKSGSNITCRGTIDPLTSNALADSAQIKNLKLTPTSPNALTTTLTFSTAGTIAAASGLDIFSVDDAIIVEGTAGNDRAYRVSSASSTSLTVSPAPAANETISSTIKISVTVDIDGANQVVAGTQVITGYTHKLPVTINGEPYFLLLT